MNMTTSSRTDLPLWAWLWFPPLMLLVQIAAWQFDPAFEARWIGMREFGAVEIGTVLVYLPGILAGLLALRLRQHLPVWWLQAWLLVFVLGCFYIAGEEASWGQHYLQWNTPETWAAINKQQETNLHNTSTWLNQKPRIAMELWILIGGIIMPLRARLKNIRYTPTDWGYWIWPTALCLPAALLCFFIKLPIHLEKWLHLDQPLFSGFNLNEIHEYNIAVFLTLYLCSFYLRLKHAANR